MSMSPHSRRKDQNAFDSGHFSNLYIAAGVIVMVIIGLTIRTVHLKMTKQLRKRL
jgi:cell division protein FtsN